MTQELKNKLCNAFRSIDRRTDWPEILGPEPEYLHTLDETSYRLTVVDPFFLELCKIIGDFELLYYCRVTLDGMEEAAFFRE